MILAGAPAEALKQALGSPAPALVQETTRMLDGAPDPAGPDEQDDALKCDMPAAERSGEPSSPRPERLFSCGRRLRQLFHTIVGPCL